MNKVILYNQQHFEVTNVENKDYKETPLKYDA